MLVSSLFLLLMISSTCKGDNNEALIPVNCEWHEFGPWSSCSMSCGPGVQTRERDKKVEAKHQGRDCTGDSIETKHCDEAPCPGKPHNEGLIKRYIDLQFKCSSSENAELRVLVLTPSFKNLPLEWFKNVPHDLVPQNKSLSYPLTFSVNVKEKCISFIELPQMFNDDEILSNMKWLSKRCFEKIIIHVPRNLDWQSPDVEIFASFMRLFAATYGQKFSYKMGVIVVEDGGNNALSRSEFEDRLNEFVMQLKMQIPPMTYIAPSKISSSDFLQFLTDQIGSQVVCKAEECLDDNAGFFMRNSDNIGKGLPWIGHPTTIEFNRNQPAVISCYSNDLVQNLELIADNDDDGFGGGFEYGFGDEEQQVHYDKKETFQLNKLKKTTYTIDYAEDREGSYKCRNSNGKSLHSVNLKYKEETWTLWSEWSKCNHNEQVGKDKVSRSRKLVPANSRNLGQEVKVQSQERYCRCSDLKELPRPRIVLLGRTGVGKSTLGSQLFGDRNSFVVGHNVGSQTMEITAKADHYIGYGECMTIIDTPGVKDTEGRDYEHTLNMKKALQEDIKFVDIFLLLLHGKATRFDEGTKELLLWYQAIFGQEMWKHIIVETTFWGHSYQEKEKRKKNQGGLTASRRTKEWERKFHQHPFNVDKSIILPFVYIDPVVDMFSDYCSNSNDVPDEREINAFYRSTSRLQSQYYDNKIEPFDCSTICKAPDEVFSGLPVLTNPQNGQVTFSAEITTFQTIEWQYLVSKTNSHKDFKINIHNTVLTSAMAGETHDLQDLGVRCVIGVDKGMQKIVKIKLSLMATHPKIYNFNVTLENNKGVSNTAQISWTKKAILTAWTKWTECSISCVGKDGLFGERTRQRKCMEGFNNDHTCQTYSISGVQFTSDLIEIGTSSCPTPVVWCPQDFYWKEWTYWSSCNVNCGIGTQTRVRFCEDGIHGGAPCPKESEKGTKECVNPRECPRHCQFSLWSEWSPCSQSCYDGYLPQLRVRERKPIQQAVGEGLSCDLINSVEKEYCLDVPKCPVDGTWNNFGKWTSCSSECKGVEHRHRTCNTPLYGGLPCQGESYQSRNCNQVCPCTLSQWTPWAGCSKACGPGKQERVRARTGDCNDNDKVREERHCTAGQCPSGGSCILGKTRILMDDFTYKPVEDLQVNDVILDGNLSPVRVIVLGKVYLGSKRGLHQFGVDGPVFTSDHQFVSSLNPLQIGTQSVEGLFLDKPQIIELKDAIYQLDSLPELLQYVNNTITLAPFEIKPYKKMDPHTPLYYIITSGEDASYIADNFVSRDGLPEFDLWPWTYATFFKILHSEKVPVQPVNSFEEGENLADKVRNLVSIWKKELENLEFVEELDLNGFSPSKLWPDKYALMQTIDAKGNMEFIRLLDMEGAKLLHSVLDNEDIPIKKRYALMQRIVEVTEEFLMSDME